MKIQNKDHQTLFTAKRENTSRENFRKILIFKVVVKNLFNSEVFIIGPQLERRNLL